ncbi:hypothetical protein TRICI_002947 [Trichomonascus ciferrii]|uniref:Beta-hexosaminidase n=1 Tax=Trichomonascus ciferrii TaxID=44093 RepID=A0A642V4E7_9ASCO|nr:hypothetical protein TRICI_002947 [Trichomonascus ciferrii]
MKFLFVVVSLVGCSVGVKVNPLPAPVDIQWGNSGKVVISESLKYDGPSEQIVQDAFDRAMKTIKDLKWVPAAVEKPPPDYEPYPTGVTDKRGLSNTVKRVRVNVDSLDTDLQQGVNESYTLSVSADEPYIDITTPNVWGALHAFTTLQQLVLWEDESFIIEQPVEIRDEPLYTHRGLLLDSGRNFLSIPALKRQLDAMALCKMNLLHWHLDDSQSWPIEIESYPEMTKDAYSKRETYSVEDVKDLIKYAKQRGIRVMPEVDLPGHSAAGWKQVDPEAVVCADSYWCGETNDQHTAVEAVPGQLDIMYDGTYTMVENVYNDLSKIFEDNLFHVGMDELQTGCYNFSRPTMEWLNDDKSRTYHDLTQQWVDRAMPIFEEPKNRRLMMWEDVVLSEDISVHNISNEVVLQSWNEPSHIKTLVQRGYDVVVSTKDYLYLDTGYGQFFSNDPRYTTTINPDSRPYKGWQRIYNFDFAANLTEEEHKHILGAEAALWSEQVDDAVLDQKAWPRAAALAELVWSGNRDSNNQKRTTYLTQRLYNFREYLVANGINASPLAPKYCLQHPHECDLYNNQSIVQ